MPGRKIVPHLRALRPEIMHLDPKTTVWNQWLNAMPRHLSTAGQCRLTDCQSTDLSGTGVRCGRAGAAARRRSGAWSMNSNSVLMTRAKGLGPQARDEAKDPRRETRPRTRTRDAAQLKMIQKSECGEEDMRYERRDTWHVTK